MWVPEIARGEGPTYLAVANAYAEAIERGDLPEGVRLPPQRDLARELGVTVGTISRAYALIKQRNLVSGQVGRGTFVRGVRRKVALTESQIEGPAARVIDLTCFRAPLSSINAIIADATSQMVARIAQHPSHKYPPAAGLLSHRADGARWLARYGLHATPDQVIVCGGAQLALNIVLAAFTAKGERILAEELTYAGLLAICATHHLPIAGLEIDEFGLIPDALERACRSGAGRLLVVQPTLQNPTTASMPLERRRAIARLAVEKDLLIVEDDTAGGMLMDRPPPIASMAPENTIYVTSISKCLAPALRVGYIAAPRKLFDRLERAAHALAIAAPPMASDVMSELLANGGAERIIALNLAETERRHELIADVLKGRKLASRRGAFFSWLSLPPQWRAHEFVAAALREGVSVSDSAIFKVDREKPLDAVRIAVDGAPGLDLLRRGLSVIARLLEQRPEPWTAVI